jgi:hypothetical protein
MHSKRNSRVLRRPLPFENICAVLALSSAGAGNSRPLSNTQSQTKKQRALDVQVSPQEESMWQTRRPIFYRELHSEPGPQNTEGFDLRSPNKSGYLQSFQ